LKIYKNGLIILLLICLVGTVCYYCSRYQVQVKLKEKIARSLELNGEATEMLARSDFAEARELLLESLSLNRLNAETYVYLAFVELNLDNLQEAYEYFVSGLNMEATSVEMIKSLADILMQSGHYSEAEKYLKYGLKDFPGEEALLLLLGKAELLNGDYESSIKNLQRLVKEKDDFLEGYKYLGLAYYYSGDKEKAGEYYKKYLNQVNPDPSAGEEREEKEEKDDIDFLHEKVLKMWGEGNG
jgi:tetratricopeptide (TPR) repeat protein